MSVFFLLFSLVFFIFWFGIEAFRKKKLNLISDTSDEDFYTELTSKYEQIPMDFAIQTRKYIGEILQIPYQKISSKQSFSELQKHCHLTSGVDIDYLFSKIEDKLSENDIKTFSSLQNVEDYIYYKYLILNQQA
jgi:hypothetical protein